MLCSFLEEGREINAIAINIVEFHQTLASLFWNSHEDQKLASLFSTKLLWRLGCRILPKPQSLMSITTTVHRALGSSKDASCPRPHPLSTPYSLVWLPVLSAFPPLAFPVL